MKLSPVIQGAGVLNLFPELRVDESIGDLQLGLSRYEVRITYVILNSARCQWLTNSLTWKRMVA